MTRWLVSALALGWLLSTAAAQPIPLTELTEQRIQEEVNVYLVSADSQRRLMLINDLVSLSADQIRYTRTPEGLPEKLIWACQLKSPETLTTEQSDLVTRTLFDPIGGLLVEALVQRRRLISQEDLRMLLSVCVIDPQPHDMPSTPMSEPGTPSTPPSSAPGVAASPVPVYIYPGSGPCCGVVYYGSCVPSYGYCTPSRCGMIGAPHRYGCGIGPVPGMVVGHTIGYPHVVVMSQPMAPAPVRVANASPLSPAVSSSVSNAQSTWGDPSAVALAENTGGELPEWVNEKIASATSSKHLFQLGADQYFQGRYATASALLARSVELDRYDAVAWSFLTLAEQAFGKATMAKESARRVAALQALDPTVRRTLALALESVQGSPRRSLEAAIEAEFVATKQEAAKLLRTPKETEPDHGTEPVSKRLDRDLGTEN